MMKRTMRPVSLPWESVVFEPSPDGSLSVSNSTGLGPYPGRFTERLQHWAAVAPDRVLLASRDGEGWRKVTYLEALNFACAIGQVLLDRGLSDTGPVLILSGNGIEHGLLSLGFSQYVVDDGHGLAKAIELAERIATNTVLSNFAIVQALPRIARSDPEGGFLLESLMAAITVGDDEAKARVNAFLEKRVAKVAHPSGESER